MRYKMKIPVHVEERVADAAVICDGCGVNVGMMPMYTDNEITIEAKIGEVYPEGDHRTAYELDVCAACFTSRVLPALAAAGFKVRNRSVNKDGREWEKTS